MINRIPKLISVTILFIALFFIACRVEEHSDISVYDARLNAETNPTGVDTEKPVFSWKLKSDQRNRCQSACQVVVLDESTRDTCWNSGIIISDNSVMVPYAGSPLKVVNRYLWVVRIWDQDGKASRWSGENRFSTGLMSEIDWQADWISSADSCYSPVFIKEISLEKVPGEATVFVNCLGYFELYINGVKIGNDLLSPAVSDFRYENYYLTYEIGRYLKTGKNMIGVWTGRGWYSYGLPGVKHQSPVFRLQAHLVSGKNSVIVSTDTTWQTGRSNISQVGSWRWNQMGGELIDDRISMRAWNDPNSRMDLKNAVRMAKPEAVTRSQLCRTNIISGTIPVKTITQINDNAWLIDFGKNFTGWMRMKINNQAPGDTIDFIYSDFCNKKPVRKSRYNWDFGNASIDQRDAYVCSAAQSGLFCPKFNYHAFRYVIIQGLKQEPKVADISGYMIEPDLEAGGSFTCSDPDLNAIYELNRLSCRLINLSWLIYFGLLMQYHQC
ncbi:MAG: family 78 glycoside hydrolase catalytic domain [Bacteroidales bacterium]